MVANVVSNLGIDWFISPGAWIGPTACCSKVSARPSQPIAEAQARFKMVGDLRPSLLAAEPMPFGSPSPQDSDGLWQLAQDMVEGPDRRGSKNSVRPSSLFTALYGLSAGYGI